MHSRDHWHILGPGAIGSLWAAHWRRAGVPVTLIGRRANGGDRIRLQEGDQCLDVAVDYCTADDVQTPIRQLLITTKAQQTQTAFAAIAEKLAPDARILVLQNGIAATRLPCGAGQRLFAATSTDGAYREQNADGSEHVVHAGRGQTLIGPLRHTTREQLAELLPLLPPGLRIEACTDIERQLWRKLAINCAINALTVKYQCRNGELLSNNAAQTELSALCAEIRSLMAVLRPAESYSDLAGQVTEVLRKTANNINSMLQDVRAGRETEIEELNGVLCTLAQTQGLACPLNLALVQAVRAAAANN